MRKKATILIIGKSPAALDAMQSLLHKSGYAVETTNNFENVPERFKLENFDLITMGGQVPPDTKAIVMQAAKERKSNMLFVQGMAGIPGLVVEQIEGELAAEQRKPDRAPVFRAATRTLNLFLPESAPVKVTAWWHTDFIPPNPGSDSRVLCNKTLAAGNHNIPVPGDIPNEYSFVTVRIGNAVYPLKLVH